ncbi:InlB B-repeat-containing protein [Listeria monocytogenes]|uniref:InlB B-repeat-containing protein n=1 Tax=Listeria monocytogenes TaxID=1639 RepID=UPI0015FF0DBE|nr:InlB B-repeat-containing protein [Listeria monocytogenes]
MLLNIMGVPIQNIVLANELSTTEEVVTEETKINESATAETNINNSEDMKSEAVPPSEKEAESTEITFSETVLEESKVLTDTPDVNSSEQQESSEELSQQREERPAIKAVTSGTFPNGSTATWNFDDATGTLSISGGSLINPNKSIQDLTGIPISEIINIVLEDKVFASGSCNRLFYGAGGLTSLDLSNLDTKQVTRMVQMFYGASGLTSLNLSNLDTRQVMDMTQMFCAASGLTSLDLSSFDTSNVLNMDRMFGDLTQLQELTLGSNFQFLLSNGAKLPDPTPTAKYTGKWQNVGNGSVNKPKGSFVGTATEFMSTYDGSIPDTYVWQQTFLDVQDSTLMQGGTWNPENNFLDAIDSTGNPVDFNAITVTGSVDTTQPGPYTITYSYGGITSTATITVLETAPTPQIKFFVDGQVVRVMLGSGPNTPEWDLTTGLWDKWNPGAIKVPTDKLPSEPTKEGYEFKGWRDTTGAIVDFNTLDLDLNSQHEFNFYAAFEKKEYTVTFDVEGMQQQEAVLFDELIKEPTVPNKAGYAFTGWYDAESGGTKWDFSTDTMPSRNMTLYARFNKLGFVTPEIKPAIPTIVTPVTPGVDPLTPSVTPPTKPGEGPNVVSPSTPGAGGNQTLSNGSGSNTGNMTITSLGNTTMTSQGNTATVSSVTSSQGGKLAKLGENSSLLLQGFGLLLVLSGMIFFLFKRKNTRF